MAKDLYLLNISSSNGLKAALSIVDHARGRLGVDFVVELDSAQVERLTAAGLAPRLIAANMNLDRIYILSPESRAAQKSAISFQPLAYVEDNYLVELDESSVDVARKDGFMAVRLSGRETPLFYNPPMVMVGFEDFFPLDTLADYVSQDSLYSYDTRLEQFYTRYYSTDSIIAARDYIMDKFMEFGYDEPGVNVGIDTFYFNGYPCHNVMCLKEGTTEPDKIIVIGGHYDSYNGETSPLIYAPGADDNASGTAVAMELARIFKNVETKKSILFAAFSAEEVGLVGSEVMAYRMYQQGVDVECMLNFDMVAYNPDEDDNVTLFNGASPVYSYVMRDAAYRVSSLLPALQGASSGSDHASFDSYGFLVSYAQEGEFNTPGWHTNIDISSRLNFPYFEQVVRMAAAAVGHIDIAAGATPIDEVYDGGDGQSLRLVWNNCISNYTYKVLMGTESQVYTDTMDVTPGDCFYDVTGLTTGQTYYFAILAINSDGIGPLYMIENSGVSYVEPRMPQDIALEPQYQKLYISWAPNMELDLNHYRLLRRVEGGSWSVLADNVTESQYEDLTAYGHVMYEYRLLAVDNDMIVSDSSAVVQGMAATFDYPLLFVDETGTGGINPSETAQAAFYDSVFGELPYETFAVGTDPDRISRVEAGQYKSMFWFDDDLSVKRFSNSQDTVDWYLDYNTNFCLAGWQTIYYLTGGMQMYPGDFAYDNLGISEADINTDFDFTGATGQNGWPNLQTRSTTFGGLLPSITIMQPVPGAEVILTYNSSSGNPGFDGQPVGIAYDTGGGKRIALGFPIYHLTESSAAALMARIGDYFAIEPFIYYGDVNGDESINILDVIYIINYLYRGGPAPLQLNLADVDASCNITILDVTYLINYLYRGGPQPQPGCVE
ncbi:MAG: M20/M25/M40 family metallo-hydrolase [Candidatus Zixiibacteriota bacterium]